jgi:hypothetical protein
MELMFRRGVKSVWAVNEEFSCHCYAVAALGGCGTVLQCMLSTWVSATDLGLDSQQNFPNSHHP